MDNPVRYNKQGFPVFDDRKARPDFVPCPCCESSGYSRRGGHALVICGLCSGNKYVHHALAASFRNKSTRNNPFDLLFEEV